MAIGTLSDRQMPVVKADVNGRQFLCLVDTGCACTMVSTRVAVGPLGNRARYFVTADGRTSGGKECHVVVKLQGRCLTVPAVVVSGLENLGVDCLLGVNVVDLMGGVTEKG